MVTKSRQQAVEGRTSTVVRRAFSMQAADARLIEELRVRCATQGVLMNQSEVVRIGLHVLASLEDGDLKDRAAELERLAVARSRASK
jgi:translation initiation factor 1 (eIF-1/SUI1)